MMNNVMIAELNENELMDVNGGNLWDDFCDGCKETWNKTVEFCENHTKAVAGGVLVLAGTVVAATGAGAVAGAALIGIGGLLIVDDIAGN